MDSSSMASAFELMKQIKAFIKEEAKVEAAEIVKTKIDQYRSSEVKDLNLALSKAQGQYPKIHYNRLDPYFQKEYSDLDAVLAPIRPVLSANELALSQWSELKDDGVTVLHTEICHSSGQWKESRARVLPPKNDALCFTSTKNQIKLTEAISLLGITIEDDPLDDNAGIQMADDRHIIAKGTQSPTLYNPRERSVECISRDQLEILEKELTTIPDYVEEIFKGANIQSLADLPRNKFNYTIDKVRKVNELRSGKRQHAN